MAKSTDERGRIYLPKETRERFGDRFRIVELPSHIALFPVDEDPVVGVRAAVGDALTDDDPEDLKESAREAIRRETERDVTATDSEA